MGHKTASRVAGLKLSGIIFAFLMPVLVLGYFLSAQIKSDIEFTDRVLDGVAFNRLVMPVLLNAGAGRNKPPDNVVLLRQGPALAHRIGLDKEYEALAALLTKPAPDSAAVIAKAMDLLTQSAAKTNLVIDAAPESYFLASVLGAGLPDMLRDYQNLLQLLSAKSPGAAEGLDDLLLALGKFDGSIEWVRECLSKARHASGNKTDYDKAILNTEDMTQTVSQLAHLLRNNGSASLSAANSIGNQSARLSERITSRIKKIWLVTVSRYGAALVKRNEEQWHSLTMILALSTAACIVGLGAAMMMFASTLRKLDEVAAAKDAAVAAHREADEMSERLSEINTDIAALNSELSDNMRKLKEAQEENLRRGKLSQLGQLTATVAHELRNPLGAVRTSTFLLERKLKDKGLGIETQLERINNGVVRCDNIITQLLDFARSSSLTLRDGDLDGWLTRLLEDEVQRLPAAVAVEFDAGLAEAVVPFDEGRMQRAVINLLSNAAEAMVGKGDDSSKFTCAEPRIQISTAWSARGVEIAVRDNGPGISEEHMKKIMEPLFTTKNFGTGLGLPAVEKIMELHGGGLEIASRPGEGACFTLWLPRIQTRKDAA